MSANRLLVLYPDHLDRDSTVLADYNAETDLVWMVEPWAEFRSAWTHKRKIAFVVSAMRHFRDELRGRGYRVEYHDARDGLSIEEKLSRALTEADYSRVISLLPGSYEQKEALESVAGSRLEIRADSHFYLELEDFRSWASERSNLLLEHFYRMMRKRFSVLMTDEGEPIGQAWNFDGENRDSFGKEGPPEHKPPRQFRPDELTAEVLALVGREFAEHPGSIDDFDLPVTHEEAQTLMREFCRERLSEFGAYQDAMWAGAPFLFHSRISPALNLRLIDPRYVVEKAVEAYQEGSAPINSVEGFVRQIIGWREYVRGMYWTYMPDYGRKNALDAHAPLPSAYWDADIDMACVADSTQSLVAHGYTHHIQRLMVLGLFGLLLGVDPGAFNRWHTSMYLDAHDWVSLPNTLGMSQFADGGFMATKPYSASGNYINRMSNYCKQCPFNHKKALGEDACPITTMYWDFLDRHREKFRGNRRMMFQLKNLERKSADEMAAIREQAERVRARYAKGAAHAGN